MIRRTLLVTVWLAGGSVGLAALYWLFLNTPESNVLMLTGSALLALAGVAIAAVVTNVAVLLALGGAFKASVVAGAQRAGWFLVAALPLAALIWLINEGDAWVARRSGEISAWFVAQFGWADVTPLFTAHRYFSVWIRWVLLPVLAVAALASLLTRGSSRSQQWFRVAFNWRTLVVTTLVFLLLIALPWQAAFWQTRRMSPTWVEPALAALRLALVGGSILVGIAIMVVTAARQPQQVATEVRR